MDLTVDEKIKIPIIERIDIIEISKILSKSIDGNDTPMLFPSTFLSKMFLTGSPTFPGERLEKN